MVSSPRPLLLPISKLSAENTRSFAWMSTIGPAPMPEEFGPCEKNLLTLPLIVSPSMDAEVAGWKYTVPVCALTVTESWFFPKPGIAAPVLFTPSTSELPPESDTLYSPSP